MKFLISTEFFFVKIIEEMKQSFWRVNEFVPVYSFKFLYSFRRFKIAAASQCVQLHILHYWQWERLYFMSNWISTRRIQHFYNFSRFHFCWKMHQFFSAMIKFNSNDRLKRYKIQLVSRNARLDFIIILHWIYCNTYSRWNINNITCILKIWWQMDFIDWNIIDGCFYAFNSCGNPIRYVEYLNHILFILLLLKWEIDLTQVNILPLQYGAFF